MIFDIEADALVNPTKIHVVSYVDEDGKVQSITDYNEMRRFFREQPLLIGHNIVCYDVPVVQKILGVKVKARLIDTLPLSWYLHDSRPRHGLEVWGEELGIPKVQIDDWENLPIEDYIERCEEDVKINSKLWQRFQAELWKLYDNDGQGVDRLIDYLTFKMQCAALQEKSRWKLDEDKARQGLKELEEIRDKKLQALRGAMPKVPNLSPRTRPKKMYKQDGTLTKLGERWRELLQERGLHKDYTGTLYVTIDYEEPNPNSHQQVKDWLFSLGWEPNEFKYKMDEETRKFRAIPQINTQVPGEVGVSESVKALFEKEPALEELDGLYVISHRISILEGFLKNVDEEGFVVAAVGGLTNTLRFKHRICVNLPGVNAQYGKLIRGCLTAPEGYELCGSDMAALEDRTKQHYMWDYDPEYVKQMLSPDFDPHLDIAIIAEIMTQDEVNEYRETGKHKPKRHLAKTANYSCTYGSTPEGMVRNSRLDPIIAQRLHHSYWKRNWSLQAIADDCKVKKMLGSMWLFNPVSKLWYSLRKDKDRFSTLNQGTGVWCFDAWIKNVLKRRNQLTAQFHDEGVWCLKVGHREQFTKVLRDAIKETNDELKLNRELDIDIQFGENYAQIH